MEKYLSANELARLKGISTRRLRYYHELKILVPAYIDPKTNYRYYSLNQLTVLDLILNCVLLGIPLKNFHQYISESNTVIAEKLYIDGKELANKKIKELEHTLNMLNSFSNHIKRIESLENDKLTSIVSLDSYYYIKTLNSKKELLNEYRTVLNDGYLYCKENNLKNTYEQGFVYYYINNKLTVSAFIKVEASCMGDENIFFVKGNNIKEKVTEYNNMPTELSSFFNSTKKTGMIIAYELLNLKLDSFDMMMELEFIEDSIFKV